MSPEALQLLKSSSVRYQDVAEAIANLDAELTDLHNIKPVFRLHPPKGGFKGKIKRPWKDKGELGYRKQAIEDLIKRMV